LGQVSITSLPSYILFGESQREVLCHSSAAKECWLTPRQGEGTVTYAKQAIVHHSLPNDRMVIQLKVE